MVEAPDPERDLYWGSVLQGPVVQRQARLFVGALTLAVVAFFVFPVGALGEVIGARAVNRAAALYGWPWIVRQLLQYTMY